MLEKRSYLRNILWEIDRPKRSISNSIHLDVGSGGTPRNPFNASELFACDMLDPEQVNLGCEYIKCNLVGTLPFENDFFSSVSACDVLEHIPRWLKEGSKISFPFVNFMNETFRILRPGGIFYAVTPMFPASAAFIDPTHVNFIASGTEFYFGGPNHAKKLGYGFEGEFEILFAGWLKGAGPYSNNRSLCDEIESEFLSKHSLVAILKLVNRYLRRIINTYPSHCLWVLQKPNRE